MVRALVTYVFYEDQSCLAYLKNALNLLDSSWAENNFGKFVLRPLPDILNEAYGEKCSIFLLL